MRGQTVRKAAFLASASGTTQGSCAPTTCRPCGPPSGQRVVELWRLAPATSTLHCPRDSTARAAECAGLSRRPASALEQGLCLILRYFPSFVFFAFKHVSGLFLWYTVCLFPVPRDSHLSSVMENSQPLFLHFCLIHSTYSFLGTPTTLILPVILLLLSVHLSSVSSFSSPCAARVLGNFLIFLF